MARDRRREVGARGERLAAAHLERSGHRVLERNFRTPTGEVDLIAATRGCIVFCEVRARIGVPGADPGGPGGPLESIRPEKRRRLRLIAREWLCTRAGGIPDRNGRWEAIRFDAIGVVVAPDGRLLSLEHVRNAF